MRSLLDAIAVAIFGPHERYATGGVVSVKSRPAMLAGNSYALTSDWVRWIDYWRKMGVDDPEGAAAVSLGHAARLASDSFRRACRGSEAPGQASRAGFEVPMVTCREGSWPRDSVTVERQTLDMFERGQKTRVVVVGYEIRDRVTGRLLAETEQYTVDSW